MNMSLFGNCSEKEFIGTTLLDTIALYIPSVSPELKASANIPEEISSVALLSSRTGAAGQILAADEAVKSTGCVPVSIELPRDTKGWGGHGCFIMLGSKTPDDAKTAAEIMLALTEKHAGEVYISDAGHLEFAFSSQASLALEHAFGAPVGRPFGFCAASPAAIGFVLADNIYKSFAVEKIKYMSPFCGTSFSNEVITAFTGETSDVRSAIISARSSGLAFLSSLGSEAESPNKVGYIL